MRYLMFLLMVVGAQASTAETRCGWIENPTPANYWMIDSEGLWVISTQGGEQATGDLAYPKDYANDYVATNGNHGYFCGCINATTDAKRNPHRVLAIHSATALPLSKCLEDKALDQEYRPRTLVHSNGKAFTECIGQDEVRAGFKGREVCILRDGQYYFLASPVQLTN